MHYMYLILGSLKMKMFRKMSICTSCEVERASLRRSKMIDKCLKEDALLASKGKFVVPITSYFFHQFHAKHQDIL